MTIKEHEKILEIPRATVRFYEKEGLITPIREDNGYRDYSEEDVERLTDKASFELIGFNYNIFKILRNIQGLETVVLSKI